MSITKLRRITKWVSLVIYILIFSHPGFSQDEGILVKKARISKEKIFYFGGGPSFKFGNNTGDYSLGFNFEAGFLKRANRILSIGPYISYLKFDYDEAISNSFGDPKASGNNVFIEDGGYEVRVVRLEGGHLRFISIGCNVKVNFIPLDEGKKFSVYGIAKPFLLLSKRTEVTATSEQWWTNNVPPDPPANWTFGQLLGVETSRKEKWNADTKFSGGMNLGVGVEYVLPSGIAFFLQSSIGFTLPVTYINTSEYPASIAKGYNHPDYPFVKKGFTSLSMLIGVTYNF